MPTLPTAYFTLITAFAPLFGKRIWIKAQVLLLGALLTPGKRTVTAALRVMGLSAERHFQNYHRVLNRDAWSSLAASRVLLGLLLSAFALLGPIVVGLDDTIERRWGPKIKARGIYRDPVRSSRSFFVKVSGLRWLSLMLLTPIPWARRVWALPFLTALAPSERYYAQRNRPHKKLTDWARQLIVCLRWWIRRRTLVLVADSSFAALELLARVQRLKDQTILITRLRLDAGLYAPAPAPAPGKKKPGRPRKKGARLPTLEQVRDDPKTKWQRVKIQDWYGKGPRWVEIVSGTCVWYSQGLPVVPIRWVLIRDPKGEFKPQALLSTDLQVAPKQILEWFVLRWRLEVTFEEVRAHLGVETQRQWSDLAILRTTPALLGLFSLVTLLAHHSTFQRGKRKGQLPVRQAAWYAKPLPTFSDALAVVRLRLWQELYLSAVPVETDMVKIPRALLDRYTNALCYSGLTG
jgi:hypothetical protein